MNIQYAFLMTCQLLYLNLEFHWAISANTKILWQVLSKQPRPNVGILRQGWLTAQYIWETQSHLPFYNSSLQQWPKLILVYVENPFKIKI